MSMRFPKIIFLIKILKVGHPVVMTYYSLFQKYFQSWGRSGHFKSAFKLECLYLADVRHY
jgi:hypothetical protein